MAFFTAKLILLCCKIGKFDLNLHCKYGPRKKFILLIVLDFFAFQASCKRCSPAKVGARMSSLFTESSLVIYELFDFECTVQCINVRCFNYTILKAVLHYLIIRSFGTMVKHNFGVLDSALVTIIKLPANKSEA